MKYYAVRQGNKRGIFTDEKEFNKSIEGCEEPEYRIFKTEKGAESYLARYYRRLREGRQ